MGQREVNGDVSAALIDLTRAWYRAGGSTDAAGPGLYVSATPFDSMHYGKDLVIIERRPVAGTALSALSRELIPRSRIDSAIRDGQELTIPPVVVYTATWRVVTRPAVDADGYQLTIRAPREWRPRRRYYVALENALMIARRLLQDDGDAFVRFVRDAVRQQVGDGRGHQALVAVERPAFFAAIDLLPAFYASQQETITAALQALRARVDPAERAGSPGRRT